MKYAYMYTRLQQCVHVNKKIAKRMQTGLQENKRVYMLMWQRVRNCNHVHVIVYGKGLIDNYIQINYY